MNKYIKWLKNWKNNKTYFKWLASYTKPYLPLIIVVLLINLVISLSSTGMAIVSKNIIDKASGNEKSIAGLLVAYVIISLAMIGVEMVGQLISLVLNENYSFGIRKQVYEKIVRSYWMDVKRYHSGDLQTRLTSDAGNIADGVIGTLPTIIKLCIDLIVAFVTLFFYEPRLAIFALVMGPVAALISFVFGRKLKRLTTKVQETEAVYRSYMQESIENLLVVKSFANEDYATNRLEELRKERFKWVYKKSKLSIISQSSMGLFFNIAYLVAFTVGAICLSRSTITYGTMSLFLVLINKVQYPIISLAQQIPRVVLIFSSAERVLAIQNLPIEEKKETQMPVKDGVGVSVENLSFAYDDKSEKVLNDVNIDIKPGEFVAIIGESGIGKTTLIRLMMSFMSQFEGNISFVNNAGEATPINAGVREFMSYVPQGNTLFSGTIRENVRMGKLDATDEEIVNALKMSAAYDFVMELPNGIDTVIGERGHGISEGQAQRIAIARCFIRKAQFIILDEATSSLDSATEIEVLKGLKEIDPKPTCIIITHRLSVLPYCDRQICLEKETLTCSDIEG